MKECVKCQAVVSKNVTMMRVVSRQVTLGWSLGWWSLVSSQATLGWNTHRNKLLELSILSHNSTSVESSQVEVTFQKHTDQ